MTKRISALVLASLLTLALSIGGASAGHHEESEPPKHEHGDHEDRGKHKGHEKQPEHAEGDDHGGHHGHGEHGDHGKHPKADDQ